MFSKIRWQTLTVFLLLLVLPLLTAGCGIKGSAPEQGKETAQGASSQAEPTLKGQVVDFIIPYSPGGGYDLFGRMIVPFLETYTEATIVPKNIPGGGALTGTNTIYKAKADGRTLGIINGTGMSLSQLTKQEGVQYDLTKFTTLGRLSADEEFIFIGAKSKFKTLDALLAAKDQPIKWVTEGAAGSPYYRTVLASELLGLSKAQILTGYPGSAEANLAIMRGDADGTAGTYASRQAQVDSGEFIPILILSKERSTRFPDVPTIYEIPGLSDKDKQLADFMVGLDQLGRVVVAPPGMDSGMANLLRTAFQKACQDPKLLEQAQKDDRPIAYLPPDQIDKMIKDVLMAPEDIQQRINTALDKYKQ